MEDQNTGNAPDSGEDIQNQDTGNVPEQSDTQDTGNDHMLPKARFDQINGKLKAMTKEVETLVNVEVDALPEDMRDIVPNLDPVAKLKWIANAKAKGIFNPAPVRTSDPDSKRPDTPNNNSSSSAYEEYLKSQGA